ncbi:hypothetical protein [Salibacter halophilus]|uniref:Outer membrane beta-barrel protein n=1 Tax=Salibacter halophilus TaxID=1803916 RepID=A0A6N6MA71_9FLAO|nr:hypothetical protein [Salibacter halophilus]KAB1066061.1 hypothetical protein F3059_00915 [Salibacter halophilus]
MKKILSLLFISAFVFLFSKLNAQSNNSLENKNREYTLKFPVSSLLGDVFSNSMGFSLGLETTGKKGWSFTQEAGYIFDVDYRDGLFFGSRLEDLNGIRLTSELRRYEHPDNFFPGSGFFASLEWDNFLLRGEELSEGKIVQSEVYRSGLTFNIGKKYLVRSGNSSSLTLDLLGGGGLGFGLDSSDSNYFPLLNFDVKLGFAMH